MEKDARTKLIEVALPLFPQKGFAGVSIRELADAAGVNSAAISYYFGGKEGLYAAVLETMFANIDTAIDAINPNEVTAEQLIRHYAKSVFSVHKRCPYFAKYLYMELNSPTTFFETVVKKSIGKIYGLLYKVICQGIQDGYFKPDINPRNAVIALAGIINFYFITKPMRFMIMSEQEDSDEEYVIQAVETYLNGVRRKGNE